METAKFTRGKGEHSSVFNLSVAFDIWNSIPIFQTRPFLEFYAHDAYEISNEERYEFAVYDDEGTTMGILVAHEITDVHVGICMNILCMWAREPNVLTPILREVIGLCKYSEIPWLRITRHMGGLEYKVTYKEIK